MGGARSGRAGREHWGVGVEGCRGELSLSKECKQLRMHGLANKRHSGRVPLGRWTFLCMREPHFSAKAEKGQGRIATLVGGGRVGVGCHSAKGGCRCVGRRVLLEDGLQ